MTSARQHIRRFHHCQRPSFHHGHELTVNGLQLLRLPFRPAGDDGDNLPVRLNLMGQQREHDVPVRKDMCLEIVPRHDRHAMRIDDVQLSRTVAHRLCPPAPRQLYRAGTGGLQSHNFSQVLHSSKPDVHHVLLTRATPSMNGGAG